MTHRWRIEGKDDLRLAWELLSENSSNHEYVRELKADIRRWNTIQRRGDRLKLIRNDGDCGIMRAILSDKVKSYGTARARYESTYRHDSYGAGQEYTELLKVAKRGDRYVLYYFTGLDV